MSENMHLKTTMGASMPTSAGVSGVDKYACKCWQCASVAVFVKLPVMSSVNTNRTCQGDGGIVGAVSSYAGRGSRAFLFDRVPLFNACSMTAFLSLSRGKTHKSRRARHRV